VPVRSCFVSFRDLRGITHSCEVQAESLYEAAVLAVNVFRKEPWLEPVGRATVLDIEVREPGTRHALSIQQLERWLAGGPGTPGEAMKRAKLKMLMVKGS
jgi:hypothetical protein